MPTAPAMRRLLAIAFRLLPVALPLTVTAVDNTEPLTTAQALACISKGNCINSLDKDGLPPLRFSGTSEQGLARLKTTLARFPEAEIIRSDARSVHCVFTTLLGFKDDVEFILDAEQQRIDFRSRSRLGRSDFGKNRSRMQAVSAAFEQPASQTAAH